MGELQIEHFLVCYDIEASKATVKRFFDYDEAINAYEDAEEQAQRSVNLDIVLLSADSLETVKRTHSSYFSTEETFESLLPPGTLTVA